MPKATRKTTAKKATTTKGSRRAKITKKSKPAPVDNEPKQRYTLINEYDPAIESKTKLLWLIVGIFAVTLILFWLGSLSSRLNDKSGSQNYARLNTEIGQAVAEIQQAYNALTQNATTTNSNTELTQIKDSVLQKIKISNDSQNWPSHTSAILNLGFNYPTDWSVKEVMSGTIIITADDNTEQPATITITTDDTSDIKSIITTDFTESEITIDDNQAIKYLKEEADTITTLITLDQFEKQYLIAISFNKNTNHQIIIDTILSTIKFLES